MPNKPTTLREEFEKEFPLESAGCDGCFSSQKKQKEIMNWWLDKLALETERDYLKGYREGQASHNTELISKIDGLPTFHPKNADIEIRGMDNFENLVSKDEVINLINQEK